MNNEKKINESSELRFDLFTIIFLIIGLIISWLNMSFILDAPSSIEIMAYLSIIFTTIIPAIIIGLKNRYWTYGYLSGFAIAGIPFSIFEYLFIGAYTFVTTGFIFLILWLIFWKAWRALDSIKIENE